MTFGLPIGYNMSAQDMLAIMRGSTVTISIEDKDYVISPLETFVSGGEVKLTKPLRALKKITEDSER